MRKPTVRLKIRIRLQNGSRPYAGPAWSQNSKLKPLYAVVDGNAGYHPEGVYHHHYQRVSKRVWEAVGPIPNSREEQPARPSVN